MAMRQQPEWLEMVDDSEGAAGWRDPRRRLEHQVEIQSHQIDQVLSRHEIPAGVSGGSVRPHWVSFDLANQLSDGWGRLRRLTSDLTGEIASALGVPEVRLERHGGALRLAIKRNDPHPVDLLDLLDLLPEASGRRLALGLDHQGQPVMLDLDQPDLHNVLVAGVSGAGKSSLMRSMAISLALTCRQSLAQLAVIGLGSAPSGIARRPNPLYPVNYLPHLLFPMATEVDEAVEALAYLAEEVAYRADQHITSPALIILVDDADMLLRRVGGAAAEQLAALLHAPAEAGVRVIVGASNLSVPDLRMMLLHNVDLRIVGRMADERSAQAATGLEKSYAEYLDGKGDFVAVSAAGIVPFQAAYIDDYDLHLTLTELHRTSGPVLLARGPEEPGSLPPLWSATGDQGFSYNAAAGRAELEPDDRRGRDTIEIEIDPVDGRRPEDQHLSWLDDAGMGGPGGGLSLPLAARSQGDEPGPPDAGVSHPADDWHSEAREDLDDEVDARQDLEPESDAGVDIHTANRREARTGEGTDIGESSYEMLPFEAEVSDAASEPESLGERPANANPKGVDEAGQPWHGQDAARPGKERARALWAVEPIYTDIDDELWEAPDDDDEDWRNRLH